MPRPGVSVNDDGFNLDGDPVAWRSVRTIATYKRDLVTYDDIRLAFKLADDSWVEVSEEEPGFPSLVEAIERRCPGVPRDWFSAVMVPAFVKNYRILWGVA